MSQGGTFCTDVNRLYYLAEQMFYSVLIYHGYV